MRSSVLALVTVTTTSLLGCYEDPPPPIEPWAKAFGDENDQFGPTLAADAAGNLALAGSFNGRIDLGGGPLPAKAASVDVFIASLDPTGHHLWSGSTGSAGSQSAAGVALDARGNIVVTGTFQEQVDFGTGPFDALFFDTFVASFGPDGQTLWAKHFSDDPQSPNGIGKSTPSGIVLGGDDSIVLGGSFTGTLDFGGPPLTTDPEGESAFVTKLD
ncbi:MAG: hypothetical protein QM820_22970 [Minicystis sp.]